MHKNFHKENELIILKNCLENPIDKEKGNDLVKFVIKVILNLTKNTENHDKLVKTGMLDVFLNLLDYEKEKDIFGSVVMAVSYLSLHKKCMQIII